MEAESERAQRYPFIAAWVIASIFLGWQLAQRQDSVDSRFSVLNLLALLLCTATLLVLIPNPIKDVPVQKPAKTVFILLVLVSAGMLFLIPTQVVRVLFFVLPGIAILVLILLKQPLKKTDRLYALVLALLAGITGLGEGRIPWASPTVWSILQVILVPASLLAGWSILQYTGLRLEGVGRSRFLSDGAIAAFKDALTRCRDAEDRLAKVMVEGGWLQ